MGDFKSISKRLRIEDFQSFDKGFGFLDFLDLIEDFFQPLMGSKFRRVCKSNLRTFLRHRIEYGLTRAEWSLFKEMISALDDICSEHNLR